MNPLIKIIRDLLLQIINRIDNNDCDLNDVEATELITTIKRCTEKDVRMSKYQAWDLKESIDYEVLIKQISNE